MSTWHSKEPIPGEASRLADLIFVRVQSHGLVLRERSFRIEHENPVLRFDVEGVGLRGCRIRIPGGMDSPQKVITVSGSADRWSKSWHRRKDGSFDIDAVADYLVKLVEHERAQRPSPELEVPSGMPASVSGLHVLHLAGIRLGIRLPAMKPHDLLDSVGDERLRHRITQRLDKGGLTEADLRILADAVPLNLWRPNKIDFDPFEHSERRSLPIAVVGSTKPLGIERRYVLVLDYGSSGVSLADPSDAGLVTLSRDSFLAAWRLGQRRGLSWVALVYPVRAHQQP